MLGLVGGCGEGKEKKNIKDKEKEICSDCES